MLFCKHFWIKQTEKPQYEYFDYSGVQVGVFSCKCAKCEKVKTRKYMNGYWSELFKGEVNSTYMCSESEDK